jgi:hypothetical protein
MQTRAAIGRPGKIPQDREHSGGRTADSPSKTIDGAHPTEPGGQNAIGNSKARKIRKQPRFNEIADPQSLQLAGRARFAYVLSISVRTQNEINEGAFLAKDCQELDCRNRLVGKPPFGP